MTPLAHYMLAMHYGTATVFECFGDSTTWSASCNNLTVQSQFATPAVMQETLRQHFRNNAATVINSGISGTRISQMLSGTDNPANIPYSQRVSVSPAVAVLCNHAINSAANGDTIPSYFNDLSTFVQITCDAGKIPILVTPCPGTPYGTFGTPDGYAALRYYVDAMREVAARKCVRLIDNYAWALDAIESGRFAAIEFGGDGRHPTDVGYAQLGIHQTEYLISGKF